MEQILHQKKKISLDLSDIEHTAKICKALSSETRLEILRVLVSKPLTISQLAEAFYLPMSSMCLHVKILKEAGLISLTAQPGIRGTKKICGIIASDVTFSLFSHENRIIRKPPVYVSMPVGNYCGCEVTPRAASPPPISISMRRTPPTAFIPRSTPPPPCSGLPAAMWSTSLPTTRSTRMR